MIDIAAQLRDHITVIEGTVELVSEIESAGRRMSECLSSGGKILWMGNGGSASEAQHLSGELTGRFLRNRDGLASIALTADSNVLTAIANDFGYDKVFARQLEGLCRPGDVVVGVSTSGNSRNVLEGVQVARRIGAFVIGLTGNTGGDLQQSCDICIRVPSDDTQRIQEAHLLIGHALCDWIDEAIAPPNNDE